MHKFSLIFILLFLFSSANKVYPDNKGYSKYFSKILYIHPFLNIETIYNEIIDVGKETGELYIKVDFDEMNRITKYETYFNSSKRSSEFFSLGIDESFSDFKQEDTDTSTDADVESYKFQEVKYFYDEKGRFKRIESKNRDYIFYPLSDNTLLFYEINSKFKDKSSGIVKYDDDFNIIEIMTASDGSAVYIYIDIAKNSRTYTVHKSPNNSIVYKMKFRQNEVVKVLITGPNLENGVWVEEY